MADISNLTKAQMVEAIGRIPEFNGLGVAFIGSNSCEMLRQPTLPPGLQTWIVLKQEEFITDVPAVIEDKSSSIRKEVEDLVPNCTSVLFAGAAMIFGVGAAPLTAGTSLTLAVIGWSANVAGVVQCGYASYRVYNALFAPERNQELDSDVWVKRASNLLDGVALFGVGAGLKQMSKVVLRATPRKPIYQIIKAMPRAERKMLAQDLAKYGGQAVTRKQFIKLARLGKLPKVFTQKQINRALIEQLLGSIGSALDVTWSARNGLIQVYFTEE